MRGLARSKSPIMTRQNALRTLKHRNNQKATSKLKPMRHSVNLVSLNAGHFGSSQAECPNKSVLGFGAGKHQAHLTHIEEKSVRQSQQTNDFWNLSRDSVKQLDLRARIYSKQGDKQLVSGSRMSQAFKTKAPGQRPKDQVEAALEQVNKEFADELNLSGMKLTDKDMSRMSKKLKRMSRVRVIKLEKNRLTGETDKTKASSLC